MEVVAAAPEVVPEGLQMLDLGGTYLTVGLVGPYTADISMMPFIDRGLRLMGSASFKASTIPAVLDLMARTMDRYPWDKLISHTFKLEDARTGCEAGGSGKGHAGGRRHGLRGCLRSRRQRLFAAGAGGPRCMSPANGGGSARTHLR